MKNIDVFIENLLTKAWFKKNEMSLIWQDIYPVLIERILLKIWEHLWNEDIQQVSNMLNWKDDVEKIILYIKDKIPDYDKFINSILEEFEKDYLTNFWK